MLYCELTKTFGVFNPMFMFKTVLSRIFLFFVLGTGAAIAQDIERPKDDSMLWYRYWIRLNIGDKIQVNEMLQNQHFLPNGLKQRQFVNHLFLRYTVNKNDFLGLGLSYAKRWRDKKDGTGSLVVPEIRFFEEVGFRAKLFAEQINSTSIFRVEQRFFRSQNGLSFTPGFDYQGRLRYTQVFTKRLHPLFNARLINMLFTNFREKSVIPDFSFNRTGVSIDIKLGKAFAITPEYVFTVKRKASDTVKMSWGAMYRLSLIHNLSIPGAK